MKRANNLYSKIADTENLELAFWKAQKGKSTKPDVIAFRDDLHKNLHEIQQDFVKCTVRVGDYHYFQIHDPKERTICAASFRERVIHHAIMNVCENEFEKFQIYDSYACRKGKGVDACLKRAQMYCRKYRWYLKLDIHKFFDSVNHKVLRNLLERHFKDYSLLGLFADIINSYETQPDQGLPIGNLTSQHFANLYLGILDHEIKEVLHVKAYLRYMDDFILFGESKESLRESYIKIENFLRKKLCLTLNEPQLNQCKRGIPFLSYIVRKNGLRLSLKAKRRFRKKIAEVLKNEDSERALPLLAFVQRADSIGFRRSVLHIELRKQSIGSTNRVNRGGSWNNNARNCRAANRNNNDPSNTNNNLGFRVALAPAQELCDGHPVIDPDCAPAPVAERDKRPMTFSPVEEIDSENAIIPLKK